MIKWHHFFLCLVGGLWAVQILDPEQPTALYKIPSDKAVVRTNYIKIFEIFKYDLTTFQCKRVATNIGNMLLIGISKIKHSTFLNFLFF